MPLRALSDGDRVYKRDLPSGGYVAIDATPVAPLFAEPKVRGHIVVERRSEERRSGHYPPLAAVAERDSVELLLEALLPLAEDDGEIAQVLAQGTTIPIRTGRQIPLADQ